MNLYDNSMSHATQSEAHASVATFFVAVLEDLAA